MEGEKEKEIIKITRRELLFSEMPTHYSNPSKIGIKFNLVQHEQSNPVYFSNSKKKKCIINIPYQKLSRKNSIHMENSSPSSFSRKTVSEKKLYKLPNLKPEEKNYSVPSQKVRDALKKIRQYGLFFRELRGELNSSRSKSAERNGKVQKTNQGEKIQTETSCSPLYDPTLFSENKNITEKNMNEEKERHSSIEKMFAEDIVRPRKESVLQTFQNISAFVDTLMKDNKPFVNEEDDFDVRRHSSYYQRLSEGSITDEEEEEKAKSK